MGTFTAATVSLRIASRYWTQGKLEPGTRLGGWGMIIPYQTIKRLHLIDPCHEQFEVTSKGQTMTGGLGPCTYDLTLNENVELPVGGFALASCVERFNLLDEVGCMILDKSTWARRGLAVQNTFVDPGFRGYLTIELSNHGNEFLDLEAGIPICQALFLRLEEPTDLPYDGKYQDQERGPQEAR